MAIIAVSLVPTPVLEPFAGVPPNNVSHLPRGCCKFELTNGVITAKIATNKQTVDVNCVLPPNFGYVLSYLSLATFFADQEDSDNYSDSGTMFNMLGGVIGAQASPLIAIGSQLGDSGDTILKSYVPTNPYKLPLYNLDGDQVTVRCRISDNDGTNATAVGQLLFFACFLQYDIEQVLHVAVNAPAPVRIT